MESSAHRALAIRTVLDAAENRPDAVQTAAVAALGPPPIQGAPPLAQVISWPILVGGLVALLLLAVLGLAHVIGSGVDDDKMITIITTVFAGLLGLFAPSPLSTGGSAGGGSADGG
jgi:hypothetical protein